MAMLWYEIHWHDVHGRFTSTAQGWKETHDLCVWLRSRGCTVTGVVERVDWLA